MSTATNNRLTTCRDCGNKISINATACPQCGAEKTTKGGLTGKIWALALLTPLAGLITLAPNATNDGAGAHNFFGIITMVFILWLTKRTYKKVEEEEGIIPKDVVSPVLSFIIVIPTYIAFYFSIGMVLQETAVNNNWDMFTVDLIALFLYFPFLKYFKYV